jgi:abortive infection bacteriophage resistance protein
MRFRTDQDGGTHEGRRKAAFVFSGDGKAMDKPFKTYDELMGILSSRGLVLGARTEYLLEREGYYPVVNGYKDPFLSKGHSDQYLEGTRFSEIYTLFVMDRHLRVVLFRYITLAEATLKSLSTYQFCERHQDDNEAYLRVDSYRSDRRYPGYVRKYVEELNRIIGRDPEKRPKYMRPYLKHYVDSHDNVPLWVLMNNLSLGQAFRFYDFQPESLRFDIAQRFQSLYDETHHGHRRITHAKLTKAYDHIKDFRNICAHDERLYCARVDKSQSTYFKDVVDDLQMVLSNDQYKSLCADITEQLIKASSDLHVIGLENVLPMMGYSSMDELAPRDR